MSHQSNVACHVLFHDGFVSMHVAVLEQATLVTFDSTRGVNVATVCAGDLETRAMQNFGFRNFDLKSDFSGLERVLLLYQNTQSPKG